MINIEFEFCTMYEPGELAPPQITLEHSASRDMPSTPRFKDQIRYGGKDYIVWDVKYDFDDAVMQVFIRAVRKVTYPPGDKK